MGVHQDYWEKLSDQYDDLFQDRYSIFEDELVFGLLKEVGIREKGNILEIGCGSGLGFSMVRALGEIKYLGFDSSHSMLERARKKHPDGNFQNIDIVNLSTIDEQFDIVFSINGVGSYVQDIDRYLSDILVRCAPNASLILSFLNRWSLRRLSSLRFSSFEPLQVRGGPVCSEGGLQYLYSSHELTRRFTETGFNDIEIFSYGLFGGILESEVTAKLESAIPGVGRQFGHTLVVKARA